jgi:dolichol kinase
VAAVVEALPLPTDDNITVPLAAGAVMWWLL